MATKIAAIPQTLEMTKDFEAADISQDEIEELRRELVSQDIDADVRSIFGRLLADLAWLRATWGRFRQFVQRRPPSRLPTSQPDDILGENVTRGELTTRFRTLADQDR